MSTEPLLSVQGLAVDFATMDGVVHAVEGVDLEIRPGETVAIVGESGSGKSTTAMAIIGLLAGGGKIASGSIRLDGKEISHAPEHELRTIRGRDIGLVPQDPMSNLNPVAKIGTQVAETLLAHGLATRQNVQAKVVEALTAAGLPDPERRAKQYPHEFSGGMRQRALIAIGLACKPRLLIADEPTSALDVTVQQTILDQIGAMTRELGTAVLLITHDLGLAAERAERVIVMHRGKVVEQGDARQILEDPQHQYTKSLVQAAPSVAVARLQPQAFQVKERVDEEDASRTTAHVDNIVEIEHLTKVYPVRGRGEDFVAVDDVSLAIPRGETVAIVGESGSGKTTTARMLLKVIEPTSGLIRYEGKDIASLSRAETKEFRQQVQPIFQDPYSSLNPNVHDRTPDRRAARLLQEGEQRRPAKARPAAARRRGAAAVDAAPVSVRAVRRPAATCRDRPGARAVSRSDRVRRAGVGAGRAGAGPDPDAARRPAERVRAELPLHLARPRGGAPHQRLRVRDEGREARRGGDLGGDLHEPARPVHAASAGVDPGATS